MQTLADTGLGTGEPCQDQTLGVRNSLKHSSETWSIPEIVRLNGNFGYTRHDGDEFLPVCRLEHSRKRELGDIPRNFFRKLPLTMQRPHHHLLTWSSSSNVYTIPPIRHLLARSNKSKEGSKISRENPQDGVWAWTCSPTSNPSSASTAL
jgi:hypothetical protein